MYYSNYSFFRMPILKLRKIDVRDNLLSAAIPELLEQPLEREIARECTVLQLNSERPSSAFPRILSTCAYYSI